LNIPNFKESERILLALDTSSKVTSLAVAKGSEVLKWIGAPADEKRSERLWSEVQALLAGLGLRIADVDAFAVCIGPGGFTGLRVGMAAAMGFAVARNKPIVGVTSLEAAAFAAGPAPYVCAMVNAYKNEVYSQSFSIGDDGLPGALPVALNAPLVSTVDKAIERVAAVKEPVLFTGDAAEIRIDVVGRSAGALGDRMWAIKRPVQCVAEYIAEIALIKYSQGEAKSVESLRACYVRPAEAEIKLSLGLLGSKIKRSMRSE
jgi:tRNA threonylcarbamoyladenosine biosynthesis protein TsaB